MGAVKFREMKAADVPGLFYVRPRTRENAMTLEELQRLGINPQGAAHALYSELESWMRGRGAHWARLGVVEGEQVEA